jgi:transcriptional regulator with XRE-family HTH domain
MSPRSFDPDDSVVALGSTIRFLRVQKELSQEDLALLAGVHPTYLSHIERGQRNLTWTALRKISFALGVPVHELVRLTEEFER